jgi:hypothetical protein
MGVRILDNTLRLRAWFLAAGAAVLLAACGGGGGDGDGGAAGHLAPGRPSLQGTWVLQVTHNGVVSAPVDVAVGSVPDAAGVDRLDTAAVAELLGRTLFQTYSVTVTSSTVGVIDPDTNYQLAVDRVTTASFQGCGTCAVGTSVRFEVQIDFTENGELDGRTIPANSDTDVLVFEYVRTG